MAKSTPVHDHVDFEPASMVAARLCSGCGAYVASQHQAEHQEFHDRVARALAAAPPASGSASKPKPKASKKK